MKTKIIYRTVIFIIIFAITPVILFKFFQYLTRATALKANIVVDTRKISGFINPNWKALAQGGEERGVRMLENVIPQLLNLSPRYIRIDHIYDFYDVVTVDNQQRLIFDWTKLDQTVCDIYRSGAKPFFSLSYMPPAISEDQSLIAKPTNWNYWSEIVQKTIEHYSGKSTTICGQINGNWLEDVYYEVWNEPDHEQFGKWSVWGGNKDYRLLYYYSALGAGQAQNIYRYFIGGPGTTSAYQNWFTALADFIIDKNLRIDFIS